MVMFVYSPGFFFGIMELVAVTFLANVAVKPSLGSGCFKQRERKSGLRKRKHELRPLKHQNIRDLQSKQILDIRADLGETAIFVDKINFKPKKKVIF
jgi:hypothetical protein